MKKYTLQEAVELINQKILGKPLYGFETKWDKFIKDNFSRSGEINNEKYTSQLNQVLSSAAVSQTLSYIRLQLKRLVEEEG